MKKVFVFYIAFILVFLSCNSNDLNGLYGEYELTTEYKNYKHTSLYKIYPHFFTVESTRDSVLYEDNIFTYGPYFYELRGNAIFRINKESETPAFYLQKNQLTIHERANRENVKYNIRNVKKFDNLLSNKNFKPENSKYWDLDFIFELGGYSTDMVESMLNIELFEYYGYEHRFKKTYNTHDYEFGLRFSRDGLSLATIHPTILDKTMQQYNMDLREHICWLFNMNEFSENIPNTSLSIQIEMYEINISYRRN
jgi:hypothetical protein